MLSWQNQKGGSDSVWMVCKISLDLKGLVLWSPESCSVFCDRFGVFAHKGSAKEGERKKHKGAFFVVFLFSAVK